MPNEEARVKRSPYQIAMLSSSIIFLWFFPFRFSFNSDQVVSSDGCDRGLELCRGWVCVRVCVVVTAVSVCQFRPSVSFPFGARKCPSPLWLSCVKTRFSFFTVFDYVMMDRWCSRRTEAVKSAYYYYYEYYYYIFYYYIPLAFHC